MVDVLNILHNVQQTLKAPKGQRNKFGDFNYRSCEDILEAVKPLLPSGVVIIVSDEVTNIGERYYVMARASIIKTIEQGKNESIEVTAYAREPLEQKGFNEAQITGSASSYARKYALNGLLCIDDTKDADDNKAGKEARARAKQSTADDFVDGKKAPPQEGVPIVGVDDEMATKIIDALMAAKSKRAANTIIAKYKPNLDHERTPEKLRSDIQSVYRGRLTFFEEEATREQEADMDAQFKATV